MKDGLEEEKKKEREIKERKKEERYNLIDEETTSLFVTMNRASWNGTREVELLVKDPPRSFTSDFIRIPPCLLLFRRLLLNGSTVSSIRKRRELAKSSREETLSHTHSTLTHPTQYSIGLVIKSNISFLTSFPSSHQEFLPPSFT